MTLRKKILGITLLVVVTGITAFYTIVSPIILHGFERIEDDTIRRNSQRATDALQVNIDSINSKLRDWAVWDDAYDFVLQKYPSFTDTNLSVEVINPTFDSQLYFNRSGDLFYAYDQAKRPADLVRIIQSSNSLKYGTIIPKRGETYSSHGIVVSNGRIVLLAAQPIFDTDSVKQAAGTLIFTKYLTDKDMAALSKQTHLDVSMYSVDDNSLPSDVRAALSDLKPGSIVIQKPTDHIANGYALLKDINGKPAVVVRTQTNRAVFQQGLESNYLVRSSLIVFAVVTLAVLYFALDMIITRRLTRLSDEVRRVKADGSYSRHLDFPGTDEVATLASSINSMVDRLRGADEKVRDLVTELRTEKEGVEKLVRERTSELHAERNRFLYSITSLPLGFMLVDSGNTILMTNPALCDFFSLDGTSLEILNKQAARASSPLHELVQEAGKAAETGQAIQKEFKTPEGKYLHASLAPVITDTNVLEGIVVLIDDVTESKILTRSRDEFFSIASHELRTPLTAIRGNTQMIKDFYPEALKDDNLREMVDDIHISSVRLIEIVNDFLDASSLEQGKMMFKDESFSIEEIIKKVIYEMSVTASDKKLSLNADTSVHGLPNVQGDPDKTKQIIYNLIGNAMKFTEHGGVIISAEVDNATKLIKVLVTDTGPGISPEGQQLLFHKFQQTNESLHTRDRTRGTGLGLYISQLLAQKMNGDLTLERSETGVGSTFGFSIPRAD